jgi:hypothetical protein
MPVDQKALLKDCQKQLKLLETDLKAQATALVELDASLRSEYADARAAGRVGDAFEMWRGEQISQAAVHWVLGGVFVRFLEDNELIDAQLAGDGDIGRLAEAAEQAYYTSNPTHHERDWLLHAFRHVAALPSGTALFDEAHNPVFRWALSQDAAKGLLRFWRRVDPATGALVHNFADAGWETRFLGDMYQDLSESARKKYALLQTPVFVEEFILDRTLGEAMKVLPLPAVTMIDPTVGSGHFVLGAFRRLLAAWESKDSGAPREALAQRALDQVAGVDLNPFAVAIARFRLLLAALKACHVARLERAPGFRLHLAVGDSLLHGDEPGRLALGDGGRGRYVRHAFADEDLREVTAILSRRYAVVVGNPPYITPKDKALNLAYRERYSTCHMKYALSIPFVQRFWELAATDAGGGVAGWVGQITANSFMKRGFGTKLIEEFFPTVDLTHVIDTAKAHIPGHGTPTVVLFGRNRRPTTEAIRVVVGLRAESVAPIEPKNGVVWKALVECIEQPGAADAYASALDLPRPTLAAHPWSLGSDAAIEVRDRIESSSTQRLGSLAESIGFASFPGADDVFVATRASLVRSGVPTTMVRPLVTGDVVRDWRLLRAEAAFTPYDESHQALPFVETTSWARRMWAYRTVARSIVGFASDSESGDRSEWWTWYRWLPQRYLQPFSIPFAFVGTHNQFVLSRPGVVFKQSAPIVSLGQGTSERQYLGVAGILNTSVACFWLKQVCHNKGGGGIGGGLATEAWEQFYEFTSTAVGEIPLPSVLPFDLAHRLDSLAQSLAEILPDAAVAAATPTSQSLATLQERSTELLRLMVAYQEELDWHAYKAYGLTDEALVCGEEEVPPPVKLGERAFEIVLARRIATGEEDSTWFARHGSTPITEVPSHWPAAYRDLVERRIERIEQDRNIALIELPEYKRRWNVEPWETQERAALDAWLLDRLESPAYWPAVALQTTRDLAERAALNPEFAEVAALRFGEGVALEPTIRELVSGEAVPFLPALRYTKSGSEKRRVWAEVWELQRREDVVDALVAADDLYAGPMDGESQEALAKRLAVAQRVRRNTEVGPIPRPPKYTSADFQRPEFWRMRGALDVPKERFILYSHCGREGDEAPLLGWAGWTHLQQAQALSAWYTERTSQDGWRGERVIPMLAGMRELLPWLRQWHNEIDPEFGDRPGDAYAMWLDQELQSNGLTHASLDAWEPPREARRGGRPSATSRSTASDAPLP